MFKANLSKGSKLFKKILGSENGNEQNIGGLFKGICENCNIENLKFDRVVGEPVNADNRTIYPIVERVAIMDKMRNFLGAEIFPVALVIEESGQKYAISLTGEEIDPDEFIGMIKESKK